MFALYGEEVVTGLVSRIHGSVRCLVERFGGRRARSHRRGRRGTRGTGSRAGASSSRQRPSVKASQHEGAATLGGTIRILFAFDPRRTAILLVGGDKAGQWNLWYQEHVPVADRLYDDHLAELELEGKANE